MKMNLVEKTKTRVKIIDLLRGTEREGIEELIQYMDASGFFDAPSSTKYHLCCEGGLAEHSLNVYETMDELAQTLLASYRYDSIIICSILHDLGKMGFHGKENYVINMIKDGKPTKAEPEQKYKQSEKEPYKTNSELAYMPHEVRSIVIAQKFIQLTEDEEHAIYYHNGKYTHTGYGLKETPLQMILHFADLWCSRVVEEEKELPFVEVGGDNGN